MNLPLYDVIIIGAGASGLLCARECARAGKKTLLLEKEQQVGRKILVTGNGRCNVTNVHVSPAHYHADEGLLQATLAAFSYEDCRKYFEDLGVLLTEEELGRIFPQTGKATAIVEPLKLAVTEGGAEILTGQEVLRIKKGTPFLLQTKQGNSFIGRKIVLACGSCAYPQVSGTQSGYELARSLGHSLISPRPVLSALNLKEKAVSRLTGIRSQVRLGVLQGQQIIDQTEGEVLFTNYGISGPVTLNISGTVARLLEKGPVSLQLDFFPQIKDADSFLAERIRTRGHRRPKDFFAGILHESIANLLIDFIGLRKNLPISQQFPNTLKRLLETLRAWPLTATSLRPWTEAMVAAGGVNTREINYNSFESRKCPGVYITGELLDVDGKSGGFNLHFAWASGFAAARHLSKEKTA